MYTALMSPTLMALTLATVCCFAEPVKATASQPPPPPAASQTQKGPADYVIVPLEGTFGNEILASGVGKVLKTAKARKIKHVVFVIDSGGGFVSTARALSLVLQQYKADFTYHVIIKQAVSASMWILANCDHWYTAPSGAAGAAVSYSHDVQTGEVSVDAKINAAIAAELAALGESKGHSGDALRAMVVMDSVLYWNGSKDNPQLSAIENPGWTCVDNGKTVLACSVSQLVEWGMAEPLGSGDPAEIGRKKGYATWTSAGPLGSQIVKAVAVDAAAARASLDRTADQLKTARTDFEASVAAFWQAKKSADAVKPETVLFTNDERGKLTSASARAWTDEVDKKISRLNDAVNAGVAAGKAQQEIRRKALGCVEAGKKLAELMGVDKSMIALPDLTVPEVPGDFQSACNQCISDLPLWRKRRIRTSL